jgi:sensor domain CHASE-containing protein
MKPLDDELRSLFKRKEPPEGFAERVLARLDTAPARLTFAQRVSALYRWPMLRWAAVAAMVCTMAVLGVVRHQHQERVRAQAEQAVQALEIASTELNTALEQAQRITVQTISAPLIPKNEWSHNEKPDKY